MKYYDKSQYHDAFAAITKITLRDGDATDSEIIFLEHLKNKLSITDKEYEHIAQNYLKYPISAPYTYDERINALYELTTIIKADEAITGESEKRWLERMGKAIGFEPNGIKEIVAKALLIMEKEADFEKFDRDLRVVLKETQNKI